MTLLIGPNNSGKTSFLEALFAAMGAGKRNLSTDDIYIASEESKPPYERSILIDVLVRPTDDSGSVCDKFPEGSYWLNLWRNGIALDDEGNDFMAFRTRLTWKPEKGEYNVDRQFLKEWISESLKIEAVETIGLVSSKQIEPMALHFLDAKRDIEEDMKHQGSFWRRITNDLGLSEEDTNNFEGMLNAINKGIVDKSEVLKYLESMLGNLDSVISANDDSIALTPIARSLRDLTKGIDIHFATKGAQTFPLIRHGMGTRSMASVFVFRAFMEWRTLQAKDDSLHPMLALEEPEAHLHPQAQRTLYNQIRQIPGQVIISTHSPYVAAHTDLADLRSFQKNASDTLVKAMDVSGIRPEDITKMKWKVLNTRGDMLFASALVLFEGETEEQKFPIYAQQYWRRDPNELGISFIGVGGSGGYLPFLRLANGLGLKWHIFSDAEQKPLKEMSAALKSIGITNYTQCSNVIVLPPGKNIETYLIDEGYVNYHKKRYILVIYYH
ncbi:ATP-dependent OLD family endonuclease [Candidatus Magnetobacterium bavaricum]|uniref:ATP-dependent OLD family endonuclease n=1 Tax=Candidatus Magnetobacterium bavaricum TaxID=29290 RepID=A0A0F3GR38_9BACT|nr:ATP-dependent OLD family endonuclease [Candidatus Magnetobacterium bavaricum]